MLPQATLQFSRPFAAVNSRNLSRNLQLFQRSAPTSFLHHRTNDSLLRMTPPSLLLLSRVKMKYSQKQGDIDAWNDTNGKMDATEIELPKIEDLDELMLRFHNWEKRRRARDRRPPHMAFLGNPETGKTMVARLVGKLMHIVGILSADKVVEVQRTSDLVGECVNGHIGPKTRAKKFRELMLHNIQHKQSAMEGKTAPNQVNEQAPKEKAASEASSNEMTTTKEKMDAFEKELSKMSRLQAIKSQLRKWAKQMILDESRRALGLEVGAIKPPHMAVLGNPGTGKTMVARLIGKLMHIVGILSTDKVVEVRRTDLVSQYIGETGLKTRKKIEEANGGILFVDEADRLMPEDSCKDFGIQALEEIMSFMDKGQIVGIFAGYSEPMERVISANEGFRRRVTRFFHFDDFSCEDLANILRLKMSNQDQKSLLYGFKLHPSCTVASIVETIERESTEEQRREMNGGLVDTMLVNARENLDSRIDVECKDRVFAYNHLRGFSGWASVVEIVSKA